MPRPLVDELWQCVDIRAEEFLHAPIVEDVLHDGSLGGHALQHLLGCDILAGARLFGLFEDVHLLR